ncbi:MAG: hypothetical protein RL368_1197 [Pseudomonadota bacterium]|jgi:hemolysin activation/secretion protein
MKSLSTLVLALFLGSSVSVFAAEAPAKKEEPKAAPAAKKEEHKKPEVKPAAAPAKEVKPAAAPVKKEDVKPAAK